MQSNGVLVNNSTLNGLALQLCYHRKECALIPRSHETSDRFPLVDDALLERDTSQKQKEKGRKRKKIKKIGKEKIFKK